MSGLPAGYSAGYLRFDSNGESLAMTAHDGSFNHELYVFDFANPGTATRVNGVLAANGAGVSATGFKFTPDGTRLVYAAAELDRFMELYVVDLDSPAQSVRLNAPGGNVGDTYEGRFVILPDGERIIYSQVWRNPGVREVHLVEIDNPGMPVTINAPFQPDGYLSNFFVSPDGQYVAYTADQVTDGLNEAFLARTDNPGVATNLSTSLQASGNAQCFTADSRFVVFTGGPNGDLYVSPADLSSGPVMLPEPKGPNDRLSFVRTSPDGNHVAYHYDRDGASDFEVRVASISSPGASTRINGPIPGGALGFSGPLFSPDSSEVVFSASESSDNFKLELFVSSVDAPGTSTRLSDPANRGGVRDHLPWDFRFLPANAPPTGQTGGASTPPPASPPANQSSGSGGGGDAMTWLAIALALVATRRRTRAVGIVGGPSRPD